MENEKNNNLPAEDRTGDLLKRRALFLLIFLLIVAISLILYFYGRNPESVAALKEYRYLGAFLVSLVGNATVLLPSTVLPILSGLGVVFYPITGIMGPILVGVAGGLGAGIGEMVGYLAGYSGRSIIQNQKHYNRVEGWLRRWGTIAILIFAMLPFFFDLVGLAAGALRYPLWKFALLCWIGRTILYTVVVTGVALGWQSIFPPFT